MSADLTKVNKPNSVVFYQTDLCSFFLADKAENWFEEQQSKFNDTIKYFH